MAKKYDIEIAGSNTWHGEAADLTELLHIARNSTGGLVSVCVERNEVFCGSLGELESACEASLEYGVDELPMESIY